LVQIKTLVNIVLKIVKKKKKTFNLNHIFTNRSRIVWEVAELLRSPWELWLPPPKKKTP